VEVGEHELIDLIRKAVGGPSGATLVGIGDDAAVYEPTGELALLTCDAFVEDVHFRRSFAAFGLIGAKFVISNVSDIAAMGGFPTHAVVSLGVPGDMSAADVERLYAGMLDAARRYGVEIVGGDIVASRSGLLASVAMVGTVSRERVVTRAGAVVGDVVLTTGRFGGSEAGLKSLTEGLKNTGLVRAAMRRHLEPVARIAEAQALIDVATPHAMIDVSDGLASEVRHLADESGVGMRIHRDRIPVAPEAVEVGRILGIDPLELALGSGEEFELLVTIPASEAERTIEHVSAVTGTAVTCIGEVTERLERCIMVDPRGDEEPLPRVGYEHLAAPRN